MHSYTSSSGSARSPATMLTTRLGPTPLSCMIGSPPPPPPLWGKEPLDIWKCEPTTKRCSTTSKRSTRASDACSVVGSVCRCCPSFRRRPDVCDVQWHERMLFIEYGDLSGSLGNQEDSLKRIFSGRTLTGSPPSRRSLTGSTTLGSTSTRQTRRLNTFRKLVRLPGFCVLSLQHHMIPTEVFQHALQ